MPRSEPAVRAPITRPRRQALRARVKRIAGQVDGVARMIDEERYCIDVLTQIAAIRSALDALGLQLLHEHAHGCLQRAVHAGSGDAAVEELMQVVQRFTR